MSHLRWVTLLWASSCVPQVPSEPYETPQPVEVPPVQLPQASDFLLHTADGQAITDTSEQLALLYDPTLKDPDTALADCLSLVLGCYADPAKSMDACMASVPVCSTGEPWNEDSACCARACPTRYVSLREGGMGQLAAYQAILRDRDNNCMPGLMEERP